MIYSGCMGNSVKGDILIAKINYPLFFSFFYLLEFQSLWAKNAIESVPKSLSCELTLFTDMLTHG